MSNRKVLTFDDRVRVIELSKSKSSRQIALEMGVGKTQIQNIVKRKAEILYDFENNVPGGRKRVRLTGNEDINNLVLEWYKCASSNGYPVTGRLLCQKALKFASELGITTFKASSGWLEAFQRRNNISFSRRSEVNRDVVESIRSRLCAGLEYENVLSTAETGLCDMTQNSYQLKENMEKEEQVATKQRDILPTRRNYGDSNSKTTKQADWTREEIVIPKDEQAVVVIESAEEEVIELEINEEGAAETTSEMPTSDMDTTTEDNDTYGCDEKTIERNFKTFRPYIETCVKVTDLIVFYDLFTAEQTKKFRQTFKTDPTGATAMAFDEIVAMENQPEKYKRLLSALKDAGYPKVERILKGQLLPVGSDHRQTIRRSAKDIFQSLTTKEILPHLLSRDVISIDDYEEISATERNQSTGSAALELLHVLPNRKTDWYRLFIESLMESSHEDLAESIDKDLVKTIREAGTSGLPIGYNKASCQVPAPPSKAVDPWTSCQPVSHPAPYGPDSRRRHREFTDEYLIPYPNRGSLGDIYEYGGPSYPRRGTIQIRPGADSTDEYKFYKNRYIPKAWSREDTMKDHMPQNAMSPEAPNSTVLECSPCKYGGTTAGAQYFCNDCTEYFCQSCYLCHSRMKVTRNHHINPHAEVQINADNTAKQPSTQNVEKAYCACGFQEVDMFCNAHNEVTCSSCLTKKHESCGTCHINDVTQKCIEDTVLSTEETAADMIQNLQKLISERDDVYGQLRAVAESCMSSIDKCHEDIFAFAGAKTRLLNSKVTEFQMKHQELMRDQIEACAVSLKKLSADMNMFSNCKKSGDKPQILVSNMRLSAILKDIETIVSSISKDFKNPQVDFKRGENVVKLLQGDTLGELTLGELTFGDNEITYEADL